MPDMVRWGAEKVCTGICALQVQQPVCWVSRAKHTPLSCEDCCAEARTLSADVLPIWGTTARGLMPYTSCAGGLPAKTCTLCNAQLCEVCHYQHQGCQSALCAGRSLASLSSSTGRNCTQHRHM